MRVITRKAIDLSRHARFASSDLAVFSAHSKISAGLQQALDQLTVAGHHLDTAYASFLRQSKALEDVRTIHEHAVRSGHDRGTFLGNVLVQMYGKCGDLQQAEAAFQNIWEKNVYSWNIIIAAFVNNGHFEGALEMFCEMEREGTVPNRVTFLAALGASCSLTDLKGLRRIHELVTHFRLQTDIVICNALINSYGKCGSLDEARQVFDAMRRKDVISWTSMIGAFAQDESYAAEALELYHKMDVRPTEVTFVSLLDACSSLGDLAQGRSIHAAIVANGFQSQVIAGKLIGNALVNMYGRCGSLEDAKMVFSLMQFRDLSAWNAMVGAYARAGFSNAAIGTVRVMDLNGLKLNHITFTSAISACCSREMLCEGEKLHRRVMSSNLEPDIILENSVITMYSKCGDLEAAYNAFNGMLRRNTQSWNAIIGACVQHGELQHALHLFRHMQPRQDEVTFASVLGACCNAGHLEDGVEIHQKLAADGVEQDPVVGSALVNMYSKCGSLEYAKRVFDRLQRKTIVTWTAMIDAFVQLGHGNEALKLFQQMELDGCKPNDITFISVLAACSATGAFSQGKAIQARVAETDVIRVALVNLYGKCAKVEEARDLFDKLRFKPVVAWNAMISALAQQGYGVEALRFFFSMALEGAEANEITFMSVLFGCNHEGLAEKSWEFFRSLSSDYGITPTAEHYGTMVDLLSRQGFLEKAENLITNMPFHADAVAWTSLLGGCKTHSDAERGMRIANRVFELEKGNFGAPYSLLTNIFSEVGKIDEAGGSCELVESRGVGRQQTARSFIEVNGRIHEFVTGDTRHPQNDRIRGEIQRLRVLMKEEGYLPDKKSEENEGLVMRHSENFAVAFGLLNSSPSQDAIRVVNSVRVCSDCHAAIKFITKIAQRKVVLRDADRFHHFQDGSCSCKDYW